MNYSQLVDEFRKMAFGFRDSMIAILPKLILAFVVFAIGYLVGRLTEWAVNRLLNYFNSLINDRFRDKLHHINFGPSATFISKTFFWIIFVFFLILGTEVLDLSIITTWLGSVLTYAPSILAAILIVFVGIIAGKMVGRLIASATTRVAISYGHILGNIVQYTILITSIIIAVNQIGIDIAFLTQLISILLAALLFGAALAFGLGAKTSVSNILASYYIHKLYKEGDYVKISGIEGRIIKIGNTSVLLESETGQVTIPSKEFNEVKSVLIKKEK
ncbi:mechanosensitive ion channel family protein [Cyclobacterium plantarum]|uniref:Mechanosensitive ion channel n=1 Tax=Cyclobacterium plantarum TaxID=2716263 RepID=A0ABX0H4C0_9BACT|nr:mechanosensitive ion channel domain-containing protein [Cyclobacterium plantarum]NHE56676.1 mechanosensitive ion channel [Cyclobacterium plantarum]